MEIIRLSLQFNQVKVIYCSFLFSTAPVAIILLPLLVSPFDLHKHPILTGHRGQTSHKMHMPLHCKCQPISQINACRGLKGKEKKWGVKLSFRVWRAGNKIGYLNEFWGGRFFWFTSAKIYLSANKYGCWVQVILRKIQPSVSTFSYSNSPVIDRC